MSDDENLEDKKLPPQLENEINEQKSQSYSSGPSGSVFKESLKQKIDAVDVDIEAAKKFKDIEEKDERDKRYLLSQASNEIIENNAKRVEEDAKARQEEEKLALLEKEHDKIYVEFNSTHETELEKKDADMKVLDEELRANEAGKIIEQTKNQKRIEEEEKRKEEKKKHYQHIVKTSETTQVAYDMHTENITRLDREIASTHDPKKLKALKAERAHHLERQGKASETKKKVNIHVDKLLEEKELIDKGKKIAKEKGVNLEHWEKREQNFADILLADNGKLLSERKRAQQKNDGGEKHLEDLSLSQKPKVLGMKEKLQQKQTGANLSSGPFRPSNTPNVKDSTSNKGHGGPGG